MSEPKYLLIKNEERYQHYKDRYPIGKRKFFDFLGEDIRAELAILQKKVEAEQWVDARIKDVDEIEAKAEAKYKKLKRKEKKGEPRKNVENNMDNIEEKLQAAHEAVVMALATYAESVAAYDAVECAPDRDYRDDNRSALIDKAARAAEVAEANYEAAETVYEALLATARSIIHS